MRVTWMIGLAGVLALGTACSTPAPPPASPPTPTPPPSEQRVEPVKAELTMQGKPGLGLLALTNSGADVLTLQGWPKLRFTNPAGQPAAIPVEQKLVPGEGPSITLRPGQTAFAGVRFDTDDANSFAINTMDVELSKAGTAQVSFIGTDGQPMNDTTGLKVSEAEVGTWQPVSQGVLVFD